MDHLFEPPETAVQVTMVPVSLVQAMPVVWEPLQQPVLQMVPLLELQRETLWLAVASRPSLQPVCHHQSRCYQQLGRRRLLNPYSSKFCYGPLFWMFRFVSQPRARTSFSKRLGDS